MKEIHDGSQSVAAEGKVKFWFTESLYIFWNNATLKGPLAILNKSPPEAN